MSTMVPDDAPKPRLCVVKKWEDFNGYGFNLHAEKGKVGQFIGKVDPGSPAESAGIKENDRIVEVNGTNISNENHQQVVQRIKAVPNMTKLLVVDRETDDYYKNKRLVVRGDMPNVATIESAESRATYSGTPSSPNPQENGQGSGSPDVPRLCHVKKWTDFDGYGFNLHADKNGNQFLGDVDKGSPAEAAGMKTKDRIIEVNGNAVAGLSHRQVVEHIKSNPSETKLLLVDEDTLDYFKSRGIQVHGGMPEVKVIECPDRRPTGEPEYAVVQKRSSVEVAAEPEPDHHPRLCVLRIFPDFTGYGFNLHAERNKPGQFIGKVDEGSPAEAAGLQEGDRIVEINDVNIQDENHAQVVSRVKAVPKMVRLLVVDKETDIYYKDKQIAVRGDMPNVEIIEAPDKEATLKAEPEPPAPEIAEAEIAEAVASIAITESSPPEPEPEPEPETVPVVAAAVITSEEPEIGEDAPNPRLCKMVKWPDFQGYGFNLHAEKGRAGHFIGTVDPDSPADLADLRSGDKIVEVNGQNVWEDNHQTVVSRVKSNPGAVDLLVVDTETEEYYKSRGVKVHAHMPQVTVKECPSSNPRAGQVNGEVTQAEVTQDVEQVEVSAPVETHTTEVVAEVNGHDDIVETELERAPTPERVPTPEPVPEPVIEHRAPTPEPEIFIEEKDIDHFEDDKAETSRQRHQPITVEAEVIQARPVEQPAPISKPAPAPEPVRSEPVRSEPVRSEPAKPASENNNEFGMSAAEVRERLSRKKKQDPRQSSMSIKEKYAVYESL